MAVKRYVLDANVFIEAKNRYYAFDLVPKFWQCLLDQSNNGRVLSIDRIKKKELEKGNDELAEWVKRDFADAFASTDDPDVIEVYRKIMAWAQAQTKYTHAAQSEFATVPDAWLVAYARAKECVVVTHETYDPERKNRIKIPNVCKAFDVSWVDTFTMLRELGIKLE